MRATTLNRISIHAEDLDESLAFYTSVFAMQRIPSPSFRHPVAWLRLGDQELHLFLRDTPAPQLHHFALNPAGNLIEVEWPDATTLRKR